MMAWQLMIGYLLIVAGVAMVGFIHIGAVQ